MRVVLRKRNYKIITKPILTSWHSQCYTTCRFKYTYRLISRKYNSQKQTEHHRRHVYCSCLIDRKIWLLLYCGQLVVDLLPRIHNIMAILSFIRSWVVVSKTWYSLELLYCSCRGLSSFWRPKNDRKKKLIKMKLVIL